MKNAEKKVNIGIQILRMISCIWVVSNHCYYSKNNKMLHFYLTSKNFHVPIFMFLSFYFYYKHLNDKNIKKIKMRFNRLLIPYLIWPLIFLISNNIWHKIFGIGNFKRIISLWDYFTQIIHSGTYYAPFWFLTVVLLFSLFLRFLRFYFQATFYFLYKYLLLLFINYIAQIYTHI